jgi:hypothetical protein
MRGQSLSVNASSAPVIPLMSLSALLEGRARAPVVLALALLVTWDGAAAEEAVTAVWKERQLQFHYRGFTAVYSCTDLQKRVERVLSAVGARPDLQVTLNNCNVAFAPRTVSAGDGASWPRSSPGTGTGYSPRESARDGAGWPRTASESGPGYYRRSEPQQEVDVHVRLSVPVEVTSEVAAELATDRKRRELIAQVTGNPLPLFEDPIQFTAYRQVVPLSGETIGIKAADCELLDQMATSAFRELGVRVVRRGYVCDRSRPSRITPSLDVEALVPVGFAVHAWKLPAPGSVQPEPPLSVDDDEAQAGHEPAEWDLDP